MWWRGQKKTQRKSSADNGQGRIHLIDICGQEKKNPNVVLAVDEGSVPSCGQ